MNVARMCLVLTVMAACSGAMAHAHAEDEYDTEKLLAMKVKDLKALLARKGDRAACVACTSKQEYVDRIHETRDWHDVAVAAATARAASDEQAPSMEQLRKMFANSQQQSAEVQDVINKLREAGIDGANIMSSEDFASKVGARRDEL